MRPSSRGAITRRRPDSNRGVILDLRLWARWERHLAAATQMPTSWTWTSTPRDDGATENIASGNVVPGRGRARDGAEPEPHARSQWNWDYHGKVAAATIVSAAELTRGAAAYKFEFLHDVAGREPPR